MKKLSLIFALGLVAFTQSVAQVGTKYSRFNSNQETMVDAGLAPFYHGVASGDPLFDRVIIWTRVTPEDTLNQPIPVKWAMYRDVQLTQLVRSGTFTTNQDRDYTVKVDADGLSESTTYYFQFEAMGKRSIIGRTRTAPKNDISQLKFAFVSCSDYENGYFNSYRLISKMKDVDAVFHLGDYQYEYTAADGVGGRRYAPDNETITLADYRIRHSFNKLNPELRDAHQQHPWIVVWDDHESTNNSYRDGADNHTEGTEGIWAERKLFAAKAYDEWMPTRTADTANPIKIWRTINYGNLLDIIMLDTRIYDRDVQLSNAVTGADANDESRVMIGPEQLQFLKDALKNSTAKWKVIGQQVMFMQWNIAGKPLLDELAQAGDLVKMAVNENGVAFNADAWDGYAAERKRILNFIKDENIQNVVILTGDIHSSWAADLAIDPNNPADYNPLTGAGSLAVEFVTNSVTTSNLDAAGDDQGDALQLAVRTGIMAGNPHIKWNNLFKHGHSILNITPEKTQADFFLVNKDVVTDTQEREASFSTAASANHLITESAAYPDKAQAPELAPFAVSTGINDPIQKSLGELIIVGTYPNPVDNSLFVQLVVNKQLTNVSYELFDMIGRKVDSRKMELTGGIHHLDIDVATLKAGNYILKLTNGNAYDTRKIVVE